MKPITEADHEHDRWYAAADGMTLEGLPEFLRHLTEDYDHDYGTICHAMAAGMHATMSAVNGSPQGHISGFQASLIMWKVLERAFHVTGPARLLRYEEMLYPQNRDTFVSIGGSTWAWMRAEAAKILRSGRPMHPDVAAHMESIVDGRVPFGYSVLKEGR